MVTDLKIRGGPGKRGLMFVPYYGRSRAFISNYTSWNEYNDQGKAPKIATSLLSHETLHLTINKFSLTASAKLDNLFGGSDRWEKYCHGLGNLDSTKGMTFYSSSNRSGKFGNKKIQRRPRKKRYGVTEPII